MNDLSVITQKYLDDNGIKINYFADWIGCGRTQVSKWLHGERDLPEKYHSGVYRFLAGDHLIDADLGEGEEVKRNE